MYNAQFPARRTSIKYFKLRTVGLMQCHMPVSSYLIANNVGKLWSKVEANFNIDLKGQSSLYRYCS